MPVKSSESFLERRLRKIVISRDAYDKVCRTHEGVYNEVKSWSALKLIFLDHVADVYSSIMKNRYPGRYSYVDLFSGSGVGKVEDVKGDRIFGSPLLVSKHEFPQFIFCDDNKEYSDALDARLKSLNPSQENYKVINGNCNKKIDEILSIVGDERKHSLIFIDPYGMELEWRTFERILGLNADIVFNFMTKSNARGITQKGKITEASRNFFKEPAVVEKINGSFRVEDPLGDRLLSQYIQDIKDTRVKIDSAKGIKRRTIVESVRIKKEDNSFYYDLLFIIRETQGSCPWLKAILEAKKEIERLDSGQVQRVLNVLQGRQAKLSFGVAHNKTPDLSSFFNRN